MIPRKRLDIGWSDLLYAARHCFRFGDRNSVERSIEECWSSSSDTLVCLAVRSGFDLVLEALDLPEGSEVLVSALNIRSMFDVLEKHGLVAVPIDLDMATLTMKPAELERAVNQNTRAILAAQLFGSRQPMDDVVEFAKRHGLFLFEDCAQAFTGDDYRGHPESDVVMLSLGPIKTCSTIMGGLLRLKDSALLERVKSLQSGLPLHSRWDYLRWVWRFTALKAYSSRPLFTILMWIAGRLGQHAIINKSVRIFGGPDEFAKFRKRPSYPLLCLIERRLRQYDPGRVQRRRAAAQTVIDLMPFVRRPGEDIMYHTHWVFPVEVTSPAALIAHLRKLGFDSTDCYSSFIIPDPPERHPEFRAEETRAVMKNVVYLPVHQEMSQESLTRLARAVTDFELSCREKLPKPADAETGVELAERQLK